MTDRVQPVREMTAPTTSREHDTWEANSCLADARLSDYLEDHGRRFEACNLLCLVGRFDVLRLLSLGCSSGERVLQMPVLVL